MISKRVLLPLPSPAPGAVLRLGGLSPHEASFSFGNRKSSKLRFGVTLTSFAGVIDEDDLLEHVARGAVDDAVHGAQQRAPGLVVEHNNNAGCGQVVCIHLRLTPASQIKAGL